MTRDPAGMVDPGVLHRDARWRDGGLVKLFFPLSGQALSGLAGSSLAAAAPTLRRLARWRRSSLLLRMGIMVLAALGLAAGGLEAAIALVAAREPAQQALATSRNWTEINHPIAVYDLAGTEFAKLPLVYRARRHRPDGAREDVLTFGSLGAAKPYLLLSLLRRRTAAEHDGSAGLADDLAGLAAARHATLSRIQAAASAETRFGTVEAAELLLWDAGSATPCLGFRGPAGAGVLRIAGFACGSPGRPLGRAALGCVIDRIDLLSARDDTPLRAVFVAAERRAGSACGGGTSGQALTATDLAGASGLMVMAGHRATSIDPASDMPPLRGAISVGFRQR